MKVILLGIGDRYWARFAKEFSEFFSSQNIKVVVVMESRLGEYQQYGGRQTYNASSVYYLTDFARDYRPNCKHSHVTSSVSGNRLGVYSDFLRLYMLKDVKSINQTNFSSYDQLLSDFFTAIFDQHPDVRCVLHDQVSTGFAYVCWQSAEARGVRYIGLGGGRISGRVEVKESPIQESDRVESLFHAIRSGVVLVSDAETIEAQAYIDNVEASIPDYMRLSPLSNPSIRNVLSFEKLRAFLRTFKYIALDEESAQLKMTFKAPLRDAKRSAFRNIIRLFRLRLLRNIFDPLQDNWENDNKFFVYPIHFQPEATSCVESQYYSDQLMVLRNIAFSLPKNVKLLVKEHQTNFGYVNREFYDHIKALPSTTLIGPWYNLKPLIKKSLGVITLNSTAGLEALMMNKPVIAFGNVFYTFHKNCYSVDGWKELNSAVSDIMSKSQESDIDPSYNLNFVCAYFKSTLKEVINFEVPYFGIKEPLLAHIRRFDAI